ncbi:PAS-domain containing protein [Puniceibacterium sp. IMCC21224]|uniref:PAS domain-containing hybrid sensor histidine kinase/response regulator n=1 Tax=Puniceibacterium sp. IMCC21224 TaxID=1618204 RepID=UPI00064DD135|nr:PAS-domain containing protein [Puniceibacterium sp. IMCC21224]KMK65180.1 signal transduction histidine kinase [Puniceibacterium sp. IMCC21224]
MINPDDPLDIQVVKQGKIIDALVRRHARQHDVGQSAYAAFQSAIALQGQVWAKTRDLERTSNELELVRFDRERTQANLADALSAMEGGFALFTDGDLQVCNDLFKTLLPDITDRILPGLSMSAYFSALERSGHLVDPDRAIRNQLAEARQGPSGATLLSFVMALTGDRWFQISQQRTSSDNVVILQTEITDIVRQNQSEKDRLIDMQGHYLQAAFDNMTAGICTFSRDGSVMIHNDRFRELLGLPFTLMHQGTTFPQVLAFVQANGLLVQSDITDIDRWPYRLRTEGRLRKRLRHGGGRVLDLHAHLLPDRGFLVDIKDVTLESRATEMLERRVEERTSDLTKANQRLTEQYEAQADVEEELRKAKELAEAAVSSKTRFLAAASHDLLQPINAAKLLISTLWDMSQNTSLGPTVERLEGSFVSIESLLHALLDISRLESTESALTVTDVCLNSLMQGIIEDHAPVAAKKGVRLDVVPCSLWVRSDQRYLLRSLQNLVVNAIQYTEKGRVLVGCRQRGSSVVLQVWDTGMGISHKDQGRIFDEFTRADNVPPGSGMGLGLSIVDRTCRHLGHRVSVRSKPGVGSVFSIEMEMVAGRPTQPVREVPEQASHDGDMNLIALVVENDPYVLFATTQKLETWGASVLAARSTEEALALVADIGMAPDILLADYQLDGDDTGVHTIRAVRAATGVAVPAIMITADRGPALVRIGEEEDFTVLTKPVQLSRLRPLIDWKTRPGAEPAPRATDKSIA